MKKYRILYTIPNFDTAGSGKALLKIAQRLDKNIFEPQICCFHNRGDFFKVIEKSNIPVHNFQYTCNMKSRVEGIKNIFKIAKFFKSLKVDLIHSFHYAPDYSEALAAKIAGIKWIYVKKNMNWGGSSRNSWRLRTFLANGIISQNTDMIKNFFPNKKNVVLIPRGVDTDEFFSSVEKSKKIIEEFKLTHDSKVILAVANLVPVKGIEYLIKAYSNIEKKHKNLYLFIVGEKNNEYGQKLEKIVEDLSLNRVFFTGKRMDVKDFHSISDIFVLPTLNEGRQEGSPVSLLEAMAGGTYVIASDVAGIRDQLSNLKFQLFESKNSEELENRINHALSLTKDKYLEIVNKQLNEVEKRFKIEIEVKKHEDFYLKVVKNEI